MDKKIFSQPYTPPPLLPSSKMLRDFKNALQDGFFGKMLVNEDGSVERKRLNLWEKLELFLLMIVILCVISFLLWVLLSGHSYSEQEIKTY